VALKACRVSCVDLRGVEHAIEVTAANLYEAVAQALWIFRDNEWIEGIGRGQTPILVKVKHPETEHTVRVQDFERWLESQSALTRRTGFEKSPARASHHNQITNIAFKSFFEAKSRHERILGESSII
jgi:hypothetical protein